MRLVLGSYKMSRSPLACRILKVYGVALMEFNTELCALMYRLQLPKASLRTNQWSHPLDDLLQPTTIAPEPHKLRLYPLG